MTAEKEMYIVLTDTGSWLSKLIKRFTKDPLNHASMAFDSSLEEVYSFGRKQLDNPFIGGFVKEDFSDPYFRSSACAIFRCRVTDQQYAAMYDCISKMMSEQHRYKYHFIGLIGVILKKKINREYAYFCSQFVATIFEKHDVQLVDKPAYLVTPGDLAQSPLLQEIYRGQLSGYLHNHNGTISSFPASSNTVFEVA